MEIDDGVNKIKTENPYRRPFLVLVVIICLSLLAQSFGTWLTWNVADDTNKVVTDIDFRNSPETQEKQKELLDAVVKRLDCNSRQAIEDALNEIAKRNPGILSEIDITDVSCSTTTTAKV